MNALSLWPGFDYAWVSGFGRGEEYRPGASRVKVIAVYKRKLPGNSRDSSFVKVTFLTEDGEVRKKRQWDDKLNMYVEADYIDEVRARDIFMRWDEYLDETEVRRQEEEKRAQERAERYAREEEARRIHRIELENKRRLEEDKRNYLRQEVMAFLSLKGLNTSTVIVGDDKIVISTDSMLQWMRRPELAIPVAERTWR